MPDSSKPNSPIEAGVPSAWPAAVTSSLPAFQQGHLVEIDRFFYRANADEPIWAATRALAATGKTGPVFAALPAAQRATPYGIITTQTCDLGEERPDPRQPWLQLAPVYPVAKGSSLVGRDYIHKLKPPKLPSRMQLDEESCEEEIAWVADLRIELPYEKSWLTGRQPIEAFGGEEGYIGFGQLLARRRGRPALGDIIFQSVNAVLDEMRQDGMTKALHTAARKTTMKLMARVTQGNRLAPKAFALYVVTRDALPPGSDTERFFGEWWDRADAICTARGVSLLPVEYLDGCKVELTVYDKLVELHNPLKR